MQTNAKTGRLVGMAFLVAIIVVLQILATALASALPFAITLTLFPIVVGAAMYGAGAGAALGGVFGVVVLVLCISGADKSGFILWSANPILTAVLCLAKGAAAGYAAGLIYALAAKKNQYLGVLCSAVICPVTNTGIFLAALYFLYRETLIEWAGVNPLLYYLFVLVAGVNFLLEFGLNVVLSPGIVRIINAVKKHR